MAERNVLRSTALLTLCGIAAKTIDFFFRAYYSQKLGAEGLGIFSLCLSVHGIMLNVATGGLGMAVSKIVSQQILDKSFGKIKTTMNIAFSFVLILSSLVIMGVCIFSKQISLHFLKEPRCEKALIFLAPSVLFMGISYCIKGYFYASRKIFPPASSEFLEQFVKILSIRLLLVKFLTRGVEFGCQAVFLGLSLGEFSSCLYLTLFYVWDKRSLPHEKPNIFCQGMALFKLSLPAASSMLLGSFLRMQENVLTISALQKHGLLKSDALKAYGNIYGMIMPLIVFPLTLLSSCFSILVPEISRAYTLKNPVRLKTLISRIYRFCAFLGFLVFCIYAIFANELCLRVYNTYEIVQHMKILIFLAPFMFMDSVSCGILNGMGCQPSLFCFSLADSLARIVLILLLVPRFGISSLIFVIIVSNLLTTRLSVGKVLKCSGLHFQYFDWFIRHLLSAALVIFISESLLPHITLPQNTVLIFGILTSAALYFVASNSFSSVSRSDFCWMVSRMFFGA